jgi:hypothetical protein
MDPKISSRQLKRFVKHLCRVSKKYDEKENARANLVQHLHTLSASKDIGNDLAELDKKINTLIDKETDIAELGLRKRVPKGVMEKIKLLEDELELLKVERYKLRAENENLKKAMGSVSILKENVQDIDRYKERIEERTNQIEKQIDEKYRDSIIRQLKEKVRFLELNYKRIS